MQSMARKKQVKGNRVELAVKNEDKPFATTEDVANYLNVTSQAVRNNEDNLDAYDGISTGRIGRTKVYWLPNTSTGEDSCRNEGEGAPTCSETSSEMQWAEDEIRSIARAEAKDMIQQYKGR